MSGTHAPLVLRYVAASDRALVALLHRAGDATVCVGADGVLRLWARVRAHAGGESWATVDLASLGDPGSRAPRLVRIDAGRWELDVPVAIDGPGAPPRTVLLDDVPPDPWWRPLG